MRAQFDLRRIPSWVQWMLSLSIVVFVSLAAWLVGRDQPIPAWINSALIPGLGWLYIGVFIILGVGLLKRWRR